MEAKTAAPRLFLLKQPGRFKQPHEHFEARKGAQPNFSGVTGDAALLEAVERGADPKQPAFWLSRTCSQNFCELFRFI